MNHFPEFNYLIDPIRNLDFKDPNLSNEELQIALLFLDDAIKLDLQNNYECIYEAHLLRGQVHSLMGNYQKSINDFEEAISIKPNSYIPTLELGKAKINLGFFDDGYSDLIQAIMLNNQDPNLFYLKGEVEFISGFYKEAINTFDNLLNKFPENIFLIKKANNLKIIAEDNLKNYKK